MVKMKAFLPEETDTCFKRDGKTIQNTKTKKVLDILKRNKNEGARVGSFRFVKGNMNQIWHFDYI